MTYTYTVIVLLASALTCTAALVLLRWLAPAVGLIDYPGGRKLHDAPVPVVGGLAMCFGLLPFVFASGHHDAGAVALALAMVAAIGAVDDRGHLQPRARLVLEVAAAMLLLADGSWIHYLGNLLGFGPIGTSSYGPIFTVVCIVGLINAMNMVDGLDGLAGSLALVATAWFTWVALATGNGQVASIGAAALGVIGAFLAFNLRTRLRHRAAVFMGDAGSMLLGMLLAWFAIELAGSRQSLLTPVGALWIVAVPLLDMGSVMAQRMLGRRSPFAADRRHFHHVLVDGGMPVHRAVTLVVAIGVACGAFGFCFPLLGIPEWVMFAAFLGLGWAACRWTARSHDARHPRDPAPSSASPPPEARDEPKERPGAGAF